MHILYLTFPGGGLDTSLHVLAQALLRTGHTVSLLYVHSPKQVGQSYLGSAHGLRTHHTCMSNGHYYLHKLTLGLTSLPRSLRAVELAVAFARAVRKIRRESPIDIVETPEVWTLPLLLERIPYVVRLHAAAWTFRYFCRERPNLSDYLERRLEGQTLRKALGITSPSGTLADFIQQSLNLSRSRFETIPYPIDTHHFCPGEDHEASPMVLFVGRVEKWKGAQVLMETVPMILQRRPDCQFVFAGRISDDVKDHIARMPKEVRFLGPVARSDLIAWYRRASLLALPSMWDNSPLTIYEAMACGTPVVASRVGGIPELVDHGETGLLVEPENPKELADAILSVLENPFKRGRMSRASREKAVHQFSAERIANAFLAFYETVLRARAVTGEP